MAEWIPVTERLPEENGCYLVNCRAGEYEQITWQQIAFYDSKGFRGVDATATEIVTHWMPLPTPPKEEHSPVYESLKRGLEQAINGETREEETE